MLKVHIECENHSAIFDLPYEREELEQYLCDAGFWNPYADLQLLDDDDPENVQVKLIADTAIDNYLQLLFQQDAPLSTISTVCDFFYRLPIEQQVDLTHKMADGYINNEKELLNAIKVIKAAESSHDLPAIVFSRVKLWTDTGEECVFFIPGVPESDEDFEENPDFEDFVNYLSTGGTKEMTAYITTFTEGEGDPIPATQEDIDRINTAIDEVDIDAITGWNKTGEDQFTFDYDIDELFNLKSSEAKEPLAFNAMVEKFMPQVESGSGKPMAIWRENGGWNLEFMKPANSEDKTAAIRAKDPTALFVTGADFAKGSFPYVYDNILTMRLRAEYNAVPKDVPHRWELGELAGLLEDSMSGLSSEAAEYIASLDNPLEKLHAQVAPCLHVENYDEAIRIIESMGETADEQPGMTGIE